MKSAAAQQMEIKSTDAGIGAFYFRSGGDSLLYASGRNIGLYPYSVPLPFFPRSLLPSSVACTNGKRVLLSKRYNIAARVMSSRHSVRARAEMRRRFYHVAVFHFSTALHISILRLRGSLPQDLLCIAV